MIAGRLRLRRIMPWLLTESVLDPWLATKHMMTKSSPTGTLLKGNAQFFLDCAGGVLLSFAPNAHAGRPRGVPAKAVGGVAQW